MQIHTRKAPEFNSARIRDYQQCEAHLFFSVSIFDEDADGNDAAPLQPVTLVGYTHNVSTDALSLVGPFYHFGYRYLMGRDRTLQIEVHLPTGTINIQGFPMRYTKMRDDELQDGYMLTGPGVAASGEADVNCLIEVSIVVMSDSDRELLTQYLRQFNRSQLEETILPTVAEIARQQSRLASVAAR
jgi:hypothetical protein